MGCASGLARRTALALGLALAAAMTFDAQDSKTLEPRRPKLDAGRDSNSLAVEADSFYVRPYCLLGYIREGQGKDSLAIAYYTRFIAGAPASLAPQVEDVRKRLNEVKRLMSESP